MNDCLKPAYLVTMVSEVDATSMIRIRYQFKSAGKTPPSYTALVIRAAAVTLAQFPEANRAILGFPFFKRLWQFTNIDISVAVEKGLPYLPGFPLADVIKNTCEISLDQITKKLKEMAECNESNNSQYRTLMQILRFLPPPLSTFLINLPYFFPRLWTQYRGCACWVNAPSREGTDLVFTAWPWPITFSFGKVKSRPFVASGRVEARETMPLVMVFDRRIMGGAPASRIFEFFKETLLNAEQTLIQESSNLSATQIDVDGLS